MTFLEASREKQLHRLEKAIGYDFKNLQLLDRALSHSSLGNEGLPNYERMEFFGDAVLDFVVSEELYKRKPEVPVGELTERRAAIVSRKPLALVAKRLRLAKYLTVGRGLPQGALHSDRIHADLVEAVVAAVYLDSGVRAVRRFVKKHVLEEQVQQNLIDRPQIDAKTRLNQLVQSGDLPTPVYHVADVRGPEHEPVFRVEVRLGDDSYSSGDCKNKQQGEQQAAETALRAIRRQQQEQQSEE